MRVLLLMPTNTYHAADFVAAAESLGVDVTVGTNGSQALQAQTPGSTLTLDFLDLERSVEQIEAFHLDFPLAGVVAAEDESTALAAAAGEALELPHNPLGAVLATHSKLALRKALAGSGVPSPAYRILDLGEGFADAGRPERDRRMKEATARSDAAPIESSGPPSATPATTATDYPTDRPSFPCVLKPTFLAASRGVIRANDAVEFRAAARRIGEILHEEKRAGGGNPESHLILVEDYIPGEEHAVEAILRGGKLHPLAVFDKPDPLEGPYFEETIYVTPSRAPSEDQQRILATIQQAVDAVGLGEGPLHAEVRVNEGGVFIIDLAARSIGGLCPRVLRFGTGISLEELILRHAIGQDPTDFRREDSAAGVMMIPIPTAGILRGVDGLRQARALEGIREITLTINPGQPVVPLPEGNRYLGFIFADAETSSEAEALLREAHACLRLDIEPA